MSRSWFLATPLPDSLSEDGRETIRVLRSSAPEAEKSDRAFAFIHASVQHSMDHHFNGPLADLGVGAITRKTLGVALDLAVKGMKRPMRKILDGMDAAQLAGVADAIEERLYPDPHG
ncbi:hypothetical protein [Rubricoccus marinus]|uniref:Uncharacterized protein n=1 Tax=Rubricoccus marinus TaxID=716817 RepID=A0A259TYB3_9BACT|nr:hypothetical protein [Rubricoccus marinus]OZC02742.1 hypothetical protein BSZ36_07010 [Rubricoccus marinus]